MLPPADSLRRALLPTAETLLIATVGAVLFALIGFPAGLISGSLLAVAAAGLLGRPVMVPRPLARLLFVLVGISLGSVVTPETLRGLAAFPVSIAILAVATVCMTVATTSYLRFVHGWDARSALFGASPGALAQVMVLSAEYGVDLRAIAIVQVMRVVILTIGIPTGLAFFGLAANGMMLPTARAAASVADLAILIGLSTAAGVALLWVGFPGGLMFGSMLASGALHGFGLIEATLPQWAMVAAVIAVGAITGSRFAKTDPRTLLRYLAPALGSFAVAIAIASGFVLLLTTLLSVRVADAVVAYAPGAQDTMLVLALALGLDPIFVGAHHLSRYMLVSVSVPLIARWLGPPVVISEPPRPQQRPIVED